MYKKIKRIIKRVYFLLLCKIYFYKRDFEKELVKWYKRKTNGEILDLKKPKNFNQKIQKLKIYDNNNEKTILADKYLMRNVVSERFGEEYLPRLIGVWNSFKAIDFDKLPQDFVIKCNHGSGWNEIVLNKNNINKKELSKKFNYWLKLNYAFLNGYEMHYKNIPPKIICEEYLGKNISDCQVYCSEGKVLFISYINNPHGRNEKKSFDENWNELEFITSEPKMKENVSKPKNLEQIIRISKEISKDFKFIRVDFYIQKDESIKISEFTFTPASGLLKWNPIETNIEIGKKIDI